jgi:hypothetical protein
MRAPNGGWSATSSLIGSISDKRMADRTSFLFVANCNYLKLANLFVVIKLQYLVAQPFEYFLWPEIQRFALCCMMATMRQKGR